MSLLVVGALHWDVVVEASRLPKLDETLKGRDVRYKCGGKGVNQALAAAAAGAKVHFAGRIGMDDAGAAMVETLTRAHIDLSGVQKGDGASGMSVAIVTESGEYGAVIVSAENLAFQASEVSFPPDCRAVLLQNEMAAGVLESLSNLARARGIHVIWNAAPAARRDADRIGLVDTLIVNRVEAAAILGWDTRIDDPLATLAALAERAPGQDIVLTLGAKGVAFAGPIDPPQHQQARSVETGSAHGAGDAFAGTFAACRVAGLSLDIAVDRGQAAAAAHVARQSP